jgi:hypothetical protein
MNKPEQKKFTLAVGIDTGVKSGYSRYDLINRELLNVMSCKPIDLHYWILEDFKRYGDNLVVYIECPFMNRAVFGVEQSVSKTVYGMLEDFSRKKLAAVVNSIVSMAKSWTETATRVGRCMQMAHHLVELCEREGINYARIAPSQRQRADVIKGMKIRSLKNVKIDTRRLKMPTKMSDSQFKTHTGWQKVTSEHGRDSAMLVYGLNQQRAFIRYMSDVRLRKLDYERALLKKEQQKRKAAEKRRAKKNQKP